MSLAGTGCSEQIFKPCYIPNASTANVLVHVDKKEPVTITAKVGTFKRKQQMRDFLEHLPKDNHDDIFTATPFQNQRVKVTHDKQCVHAWAGLGGVTVCSASSINNIWQI